MDTTPTQEELDAIAEEKEFIEFLTRTIRDVPDYPKPGIMFKDITPVLSNPELTDLSTELLAMKCYQSIEEIHVVAGVESRGFLFGILLANRLGVPFVPVRKAGKLPYHKISESYNLEYGAAEIEMHADAIEKGVNVLITDDLLATAGTACAAARLIKKLEGNVVGFAFLIELGFLLGRKKLEEHSNNIITLVNYNN